jgi:predicted DNA-binding transcriptional regulator YafY
MAAESLGRRKPGREPVLHSRPPPQRMLRIHQPIQAGKYKRNDLRIFIRARIKAIKQTGKTFLRPQKFSLKKRLRDGFGVHSGQGQYDVVIHFNGGVADYIREEKWHDSQKLRELKKGAVELRLRLSSLAEIQRWVLGWGGNEVVINPAELADSIRQAAKKILEPQL